MMNFKKPISKIEEAATKAGNTVTKIAIVAGVAVLIALVALVIAIVR